jgi:pyrroloquinoline quinone (PQQ) biosynthesis protein C
MQPMRDLTGNTSREGDTALDDLVARRTRSHSRRAIGRPSPRPLAPAQLRDRLLSVMDRKNHWAWSAFTGPSVSKAQLKIHFQQEFATYVRDFPVLLARIHAKNPPAGVRRMLAENIYEEDTGGLSFGKSHAELFLAMMKGFGFAESDFENIRLQPAARAYRDWLDRVTHGPDWVRAAATMAIFVEGSIHDRREILDPAEPRTEREIEEVVRGHPLVRYHGLSPDCMDLTRAHQRVETGHRHHAYAMVVAGANSSRHQQAVIACVEKTLALWLRYRDGVARACGLAQ